MSGTEHRYFILYKPFMMLSQFTSQHAKHRTLADVEFDFPSDAYPVGRLDRNTNAKWLTTKGIVLSGPDSAVQADGDIVGHLPVEITASDRTLDVLYP